jgi:hypothetical protein
MIKTGIAMAFATLIIFTPCGADSLAMPREEHGWDFHAAAYLWMANIDGSQTVRGQEAELEVGFGDIFNVLEFAAEGRFEAMKDNRWGFYVDGTYLKLGPEAKQGPIDIHIGYQYWLAELGGLYRAKTWPTNHGHAAVDVVLGGRYTRMDVKLDFQNTPLPSQSARQSWTDPFVGVRLITDLPGDWAMALRGDVGGFGIGNSSNLSAQGSLIFHWTFRPRWNLVAGYRALYQDYETGRGPIEFAYRATTHGPLLGVGYRF